MAKMAFMGGVTALGCLLGICLVAGLLSRDAEAQGAGEKATEMRTVAHVDVARYMGRWYEIAAIPASFQRDCAGGTTATYTLRPDGDVEVLNQCYTAEGKLKRAKGRAWVTDPGTNAKLRVSFIPWLKLSFLAGDYWIIDLSPDYEYAVVGHPSRQYGWVLSRTPELSVETLSGIRARLEAKGYDWSSFRMTEQKNQR